MKASDGDTSKMRWPGIAQPKLDGVRALKLLPSLTARSLKKYANLHTTKKFSVPECDGFDGEMAAESETHPDLCRLTTSALTTIKGEPYLLWHLFDHITSDTISLPYYRRQESLKKAVYDLGFNEVPIAQHLRIVPSTVCNSEQEFLDLEDRFLEAGYEGIMYRDPEGKYKEGYSTQREGGLLRVKRFVDFEVIVTAVHEGEHNANEAQINELGNTFRSTHMANMVPNGMVGTLTGVVVKDVYDPTGTKALLLRAGQEITIAAGKMVHADRIRFFQQPSLIVGKPATCKLFPKGQHLKPRFPTFKCLRDANEMS